jgi:hypothetical protein
MHCAGVCTAETFHSGVVQRNSTAADCVYPTVSDALGGNGEPDFIGSSLGATRLSLHPSRLYA